MLKEESLIHYEASFCYDAFQFCVLVRVMTISRCSVAETALAGVRLLQRESVDTKGVGGVVHNVWSGQQRRPHVQGVLGKSPLAYIGSSSAEDDTVWTRLIHIEDAGRSWS